MKKILAMLLTGVMIIGTLSGCGDGTTEWLPPGIPMFPLRRRIMLPTKARRQALIRRC